MKKLVAGMCIFVLGVVGYCYLFAKYTETVKTDKKTVFKVYAAQERTENVKKSINDVTSLAEIVKVEQSIKNLPVSQQEKFQPYLGIKKAIILFIAAEDFLKKAAEIESAVSLDSSAQKPLNPFTLQMLQKAGELYEAARKEADRYNETPDNTFNYNINYLKGEIYYRILQFMSTDENAQELFNQTLAYYKLALRYRPADINTVINIELLIKNQNSLLANAAGPNAKRRQMLNAKKAGLGHSTGN